MSMEERKPITIDDYMNDETRVTRADRERIHLEVAKINKMIESREQLPEITTRHAV